MAGSKSNYLEDQILDYILGDGTFAQPANVYIALFTAQAEGSQTEVTVANAYARVTVANNVTNWPAAASGVKSNGTVINFPTATGAWGTVTGFGIYDAATVGNLLFWGDLTASKVVGNGDTVSFAIGAITITED